MNRLRVSYSPSPPMGTRLLNLGCGSRMHPLWTNVDFNVTAPGIIAHDLRLPLPFETDSFHAVYHSHALEHLDRHDGEQLIEECWRVLAPHGVLRVVVPDVERACRCYLETVDSAEKNDHSVADHEWMMLELFDQFSRTKSGGEMLEYLRSETLDNESFVRSRLGDELVDAVRTNDLEPSPLVTQTFHAPTRAWRRASNEFARLRLTVARVAMRALLGSRGSEALAEGWFRQVGEVHRWAYDRLSLSRLLEKNGFKQVEVLDAFTSAIPDFQTYELDTAKGRTRKPDSLFVEAIKPPS